MRKDYSGQSLKIKDGFTDPFNGKIPAGTEYLVEGYWDEVTGKSWRVSSENPAALNYLARVSRQHLPIDNDVLYGKIGPYGFLVHISEVEA